MEQLFYKSWKIQSKMSISVLRTWRHTPSFVFVWIQNPASFTHAFLSKYLFLIAWIGGGGNSVEPLSICWVSYLKTLSTLFSLFCLFQGFLRDWSIIDIHERPCDSLVNKPGDESISPITCSRSSSEALFMQFRFPGLKYVAIFFHKGPRRQSIHFTLLDLLEDVA